MLFDNRKEMQGLRQELKSLQSKVESKQQFESLQSKVESLRHEITALKRNIEQRDRKLFEAFDKTIGVELTFALKEFYARIDENTILLKRAVKVAEDNQFEIGEIRNTQINLLGNNTLTDQDNRVWYQKALNDIDLNELARELQQLRSVMRDESSETEHDISIGKVGEAEKAAKEGKGRAALEYLKQSGTWAFDVANKIGVGVAIAALKVALGL